MSHYYVCVEFKSETVLTVRDIVFNLRSYANENYSGKYFSDRVILVADSAVVPWVFPASVVVIGKPSFFHFVSEVKLRRKKNYVGIVFFILLLPYLHFERT